MNNNKTIIGSEEWCAFPDMGLPAIKARIDTGAKTSSIHAFNIQTFRRGGQSWVSFEVHPLQQNRNTVVRCEKPIIDRRSIKSSSGLSETRYVVSAALKLGNEVWDIELTLANRDSMGYRMLLGREAMSNRLVIDPAHSFRLGKLSASDATVLYGKTQPEKSGLKIALMASDQELYSNQRLLEAGEERGHEMVFLDLRQCYTKLDAKTPQVHYRGGKKLDDLNAVITRLRPGMTQYGCALARQFENMKIHTVNSASAILRSWDRLSALQLLLDSGISIPTTAFANAPMDTRHLIEMVGGAPLVVKLMEGSQGRGVVLAETQKAAESIINGFKSLHANLLVQAFIKEAEGRDLRCFVIDGKVAAAIQRQAAPGEFRANIHQGGSASVVKITPEERKLAARAARVMELDVAGVDIIRSKHGPLLLEVNATPGLEGIESATGKDIAGMVIASIEKKLGWERQLGKPG